LRKRQQQLVFCGGVADNATPDIAVSRCKMETGAEAVSCYTD